VSALTSAGGVTWQTWRVGDELLNTVEAAKALRVSPATLQRWVTEGVVTPTLRLPGGRFRWDLDDLKRQLAARDQDGARADDR
jgi:phage terminase Nu1 subunit (DNA packaging protein)